MCQLLVVQQMNIFVSPWKSVWCSYAKECGNAMHQRQHSEGKCYRKKLLSYKNYLSGRWQRCHKTVHIYPCLIIMQCIWFEQKFRNQHIKLVCLAPCKICAILQNLWQMPFGMPVVLLPRDTPRNIHKQI